VKNLFIFSPRQLRASVLVLMGSMMALATPSLADSSRPPTFRPAAQASVSPEYLATDDDRIRPDNGKEILPAGPRDGLSRPEPRTDQEKQWIQNALKSSAFTEIGGDDVLVRDSVDISTTEIAVAEDGTIFVATGNHNYDISPSVEYIYIFRSLDGGTTFHLWGNLGTPTAGNNRLRDIDVTGGSHARVFVTYMRYTGSFSIDVAMADPTAAVPSWTINTPLTGVASFLNPDLETDHRSFDSYYVYLVASGLDGNGDDIWFTRSTNQGDTWAAPYRIAELSSSGNLMYSWPRVTYGFGGMVHVGWTYTERLQSTFDDGVRYRSAPSYGGDPAGWGSIYAIASTGDEIDQRILDISASLTGNEVVLMQATTWVNWENPEYRVSTDAGGNWWSVPLRQTPWDRGGDMDYSLAGNQFVGTGIYFVPGGGMEQVLATAPAIATAGWYTPQRFSDQESSYLFWPQVGLDPSRNDQAIVAVRDGYSAPKVTFDAAWRGDPGYPNLEDGMPRELESAPISPPALVDLDGDGDLEIIYGTIDGLVEVRHHDGERAAGWPVAMPSLSAGAVAIGELAGSQLSVVAGTTDGRVFAFDKDGQLQPGWPHDLGTDASVYVTIGALGGPYPRTVVAGSGNKLTFLNYRGVSPLETFGWTVFSGNITSNPAIGDIDGDGISELVVAAGSSVFGLRLYDPEPVFSRDVGASISDAVTLGDVDLDGDVEIAVPTSTGQLFVLDGDGSDMAGWPFTTPSATPLTSAAWAHIRGTFAPELAVAAQAFNVHLLYADGLEASGYPVETGTGWWLLGQPIMGRVEGGSGDVVIGSRDTNIWAWDNFGNRIPGWPKNLGVGNQINLEGAMGDIDLDGRNEVVMLSPDELLIVDVNSTVLAAHNTWPMYGHDAQRTGCSDCQEDLLSPVGEEDADQVTRIMFKGAYPNPVSGPSTRFSFAVPVRARAKLEIYDLRGRRVQRILQEEVPAGEHVLTWNGRDDQGRQVASGQYLARLSVKGPGLNEDLTRRVTVLR
jgi:hypothetical protein